MLIIFGGLPATEKTTIARALAERLKAMYLRIDTIENVISPLLSEVNEVGYQIAYDVARDNLRLGLTVVCDSVNPIAITREHYREIALQCNVPFLEVEIVCSDKAEHRKRVENRLSDIEGFTLPTWAEVESRYYEPWDEKHLVIDTAKLSVEESVEAILKEILF